MCFYFLWCFSANLYFVFHNKLLHLVPDFGISCVCGFGGESHSTTLTRLLLWLSPFEVYSKYFNLPASICLMSLPWSWDTKQTKTLRSTSNDQLIRQYPQHLRMFIVLYGGSLGEMFHESATKQKGSRKRTLEKRKRQTPEAEACSQFKGERVSLPRLVANIRRRETNSDFVALV